MATVLHEGVGDVKHMEGTPTLCDDTESKQRESCDESLDKKNVKRKRKYERKKGQEKRNKISEDLYTNQKESKQKIKFAKLKKSKKASTKAKVENDLDQQNREDGERKETPIKNAQPEANSKSKMQSLKKKMGRSRKDLTEESLPIHNKMKISNFFKQTKKRKTDLPEKPSDLNNVVDQPNPDKRRKRKNLGGRKTKTKQEPKQTSKIQEQDQSEDTDDLQQVQSDVEAGTPKAKRSRNTRDIAFDSKNKKPASTPETEGIMDQEIPSQLLLEDEMCLRRSDRNHSCFHLPVTSRRSRPPPGRPPKQQRLLDDRVIGNQACVLWSSEQRRRYQQEYPRLSSSGLDQTLRKEWRELTNREKLAYYTRASELTHRHVGTTGQSRDERTAGPNRPTPRAPDLSRCDKSTFSALSPASQHHLLSKKILYLQRTLPEHLHAHLAKHVINRTGGARDAAARLTRRTQLWTDLADVEARTTELKRLGVEWQAVRMRDDLRLLIERGASAGAFGEDSEELSEILQDLGQCSADKHYPSHCEQGHDIICQITEDLKIVEDSISVPEMPAAGNLDVERALLGRAITAKELPVLSETTLGEVLSAGPASVEPVPSLKEVYMMQNEVSHLKQAMGGCCELGDPSCVLSGMVLVQNASAD